MKMIYYPVACLAIVTHINFAAAQSALEDLNSMTHIQKGVEAYDDGDYKKAMEYYRKVPAGDTNYYAVQYELGLVLLADSQFTQSIALNLDLLKNYKNEERQILLNIGTAYSSLNEYDKALAYYDTAHRRFPTDNRPLYESGVVYLKKEDYEKGMAYLQQSLLYNPRHFRSHWLLGICYLEQGRLAEAYIALQAALTTTSNASDAKTILQLLHGIAMQNDMVQTAYAKKSEQYSHYLFDDIDAIIHSKLALGKEYKIQSKFDDVIIRQLQVIFEKIEFDAKDDNFVMQYYIPFLMEIRNKQLFDSYVLYILSDYGIESIDKVAGSRKGKSKLSEIAQVLDPYNAFIMGTRELFYKKRSFDKLKYFSPGQNEIIVEGKPKDQTLNNFAEGPVKYYQFHNLAAEGRYNANGNKEGTWKYYYPNGKLRSEETIKDGKANYGTFTKYYENGNIDYQVNYDKEGNFVSRKDYKFSGPLYSSQTRNASGDYKITYYYENGKEFYTKVLTGKNTDIEADGAVVRYFPDGSKYMEYNIVKGKVNGLFKEYFPDGKARYEIEYKDGVYDGQYTSFFKNGQIDSKCKYVNGKPQGSSEDYFEYSESFYTQEFNKGLLNGSVKYYNKNKEFFGEIKYENDLPVAISFKDLSGTTVAAVNNSKGLDMMEHYNQYGVRTSAIKLNKKGTPDGEVKRFYDFGGILNVEYFKEGSKDGKATYYYENGTVSHTRTFTDGQESGAYQAFSEDGKLSTEGWLLDGRSEGQWKNYFSNGKLRQEYFMLNDNKNGPDKHYNYDGKLAQTNLFEKGVMVGVVQYDTSGHVFNRLDLPAGNGIYVTKYANGNIKEEVPIKYGSYNGQYKLYAIDKTLLESGNYENGKIEGPYELYHPNGVKFFYGKYKSGDRYGMFTVYDLRGMVTDESNYRDGDLHGLNNIYCGGQLRYQNNFYEGEKHGKSVIYGENKKVAGIIHYDKGTVIGYSYIGKDGKEVPMTPIKNGTGKALTYYENGAKGLDFTWINNGYDGSQKIYYSNGTLAEERNFKKGMYHGAYKRWNPDGTTYYTANYDLDKLDGTESLYDEKGNLLGEYNYIAGLRHGNAMVKSTEGKQKQLKFYYGTSVQ